MTNLSTPVIGIIGGTGKEGKGLAYRWAKAGLTVLIGSRQREKAEAAASEVRALAPGAGSVSGITNEEAAEKAEIVVITVPFAAHVPTCEVIKPFVQGKIVIDVVVPLVPPKVAKVQMPAEGSATRQAQLILGEDVQVVAAFQNISYDNLLTGEEVDCDVLVCGGNREAREKVVELVNLVGLVGWNAGPVENAVVVEGMTSVLIGLNKQYGVKASGIRITGINRAK